MSSSSENFINALKLPQITNPLAGDFIPVITQNGAKIVDYTNLNIVPMTKTGGASYTDTLSATDILVFNGLSATNLTINGVDFTDLSTKLAVTSADLYTVISTVSAIDQSTNVITLSTNQSNNTSNIATLSTNLAALSAVAIVKTRVYSQSKQAIGNTTTPVSISFTDIPAAITSVYSSNINIIVYDNTYAAINTPIIITADVNGVLTPSAGTLTISCVVNTTKSFSATLTVFY